MSSRLVFLLGTLLALGCLTGTALAQAVISPDWSEVRRGVVEMQVHRPGQPHSRAYGFALEGVEGIITCQQLVSGAERVFIRVQGGEVFETTEYVAHDTAHDLIVLTSPQEVPPLRRGSHLMLAQRQYGLVPLPPSVKQDTYKMTFVSVLEIEGAGDLLACWGDISPGLPYADSLGRAVGVIEILESDPDKVAFAVPIDRVYEMMAAPDEGGSLASLEPEDKAAWTEVTSADGSLIMGAILARISRFDTAFPYLTRAMDLKRDQAAPLLEWGMACQIQKDFAAAEAYYADALKIDRGSARGHVYLGSCYFQQGKNEQAEAAFQAAIDADPKWAMPLVNLGGLYYSLSRPAEAEALMQRAIALEPLQGLAHLNLGMMYFADGRYAEGRKTLDLLRAQGSGYASRLSSMARSAAGR